MHGLIKHVLKLENNVCTACILKGCTQACKVGPGRPPGSPSKKHIPDLVCTLLCPERAISFVRVDSKPINLCTKYNNHLN